MDETLGQHIRALRTTLHLSLRELAEKANITPPFLSDIELGRRNPSEATLRELAKHLKTTYDDLLSYDQRPIIETIKTRTTNDPRYARMLRELVEKHTTADELAAALRKK